jgi:hypothetical protein
MNAARLVWLQEGVAAAPHFRSLGTLPCKYLTVPSLESADVLVASVDYLLGLPQVVTAAREVVAVNAFDADPEGIIELQRRIPNFRIGEPSVIAMSSMLLQLLEPLAPGIPGFVEILVHVDQAMTHASRLAEMLVLACALGMPESSAWHTSVARSSSAMACSWGSIAMAAAHRTSAGIPRFIEISVTAAHERRIAYMPTDGSAKPAEISAQSRTGQWVSRPLYSSPLRHFWDATSADYVVDVHTALLLARRVL